MKRLLPTIFAVGASWLVSPSFAASFMHETAVEVAALPRFCWAHYSEKPLGPEFDIPRSSCGVAMNHYCDGLLLINRAPKAKSKNEQKQDLQRGLANTEYTLAGMKDYPSCPIRSHVEGTLKRARSALGLPPAPPPATPGSP